jgi:hypothetical protein
VTDPIERLARVHAAFLTAGLEHAFVGAGVLPLYLSDALRAWAEQTHDVDVVVAGRTRAAFRAAERRLEAVGLRHDTREGAPICRWTLEDVQVDVLPEEPGILGLQGALFPQAFAARHPTAARDGLEIPVVPLPWFAGLKARAYLDRGAADPWASKDLDDLLLLLEDHGEALVAVVLDPASPAELRDTLAALAAALSAHPRASELVEAHLHPSGDLDRRSDRVVELLARMRR